MTTIMTILSYINPSTTPRICMTSFTNFIATWTKSSHMTFSVCSNTSSYCTVFHRTFCLTTSIMTCATSRTCVNTTMTSSMTSNICFSTFTETSCTTSRWMPWITSTITSNRSFMIFSITFTCWTICSGTFCFAFFATTSSTSTQFKPKTWW